MAGSGAKLGRYFNSAKPSDGLPWPRLPSLAPNGAIFILVVISIYRKGAGDELRRKIPRLKPAAQVIANPGLQSQQIENHIIYNAKAYLTFYLEMKNSRRRK